jgi:hypothetical protein
MGGISFIIISGVGNHLLNLLIASSRRFRFSESRNHLLTRQRVQKRKEKNGVFLVTKASESAKQDGADDQNEVKPGRSFCGEMEQQP